jgi:hypothetical protein
MMAAPYHDRRADQRGFALETTMVVLVVLTIMISAAVTGLVVNLRISGSDYRGSRVSAAAEAGSDAIMAQLDAGLSDGVLTDAELSGLTAPVVPGFTFSAISAVKTGTAVLQTVTRAPYAGLIGLNTPIDITIEARDPLNNKSRDIVTVNAEAIPLFQFGVFYEGDLEIGNGPSLDFAGWVHSNGNIYLTSGAQTNFHSQITTPDSIYLMRKGNTLTSASTYIDNAAGTPVQLTWDSRSSGSDAQFVLNSQRDFDGRVQSGATKVSPLRLPLPLGVPAIEMVNPRNAGDNAQVQAVKFAWKATWNLTFDLAKLDNVCDNLNSVASLPASHPKPTQNECKKGPAALKPIFNGKPSAFWDGRENTGVDVLDIDVLELQTWVNVAPGPRTASILYISFINSDPVNVKRDYPAVRLINGARLLFPMTVATDRPLYVRGDFNTVGWQPASLLGDAITILSNAWYDTASVHKVGSRKPNIDVPSPGQTTAATTAVWAAIAAGHSSTPCDVNRAAPTCNPAAFVPPPLVNSTSGASYGGGLENFPRFLENWSGVTFTYRGSLVSLFDSQYANRRRWGWTDYYSPPTRDWHFDTRFQDPANFPPGTPTAGSVVQTAFRPVY